MENFLQNSQAYIISLLSEHSLEDHGFIATTPLSGAYPLLLILYPTKQDCVLAVPWAAAVYATSKKNTPNLPVVQLILCFFHSLREANKVAFVLLSRGDRNTRTGQGLRLRPSFVRLLLPLLTAAITGHVLNAGSSSRAIAGLLLPAAARLVVFKPHAAPCKAALQQSCNFAFPVLIRT